jgi:hypothetical protein
MVAVSIVVGLTVAVTVCPPVEVPTVALRAVPVYRVEVGAVVFFGLYIATMAFALALRNRGFTEIGSSGFKARDLAAVSEDAVSGDVSMELLAEIRDEVDDLRLQREGIGNAY